MKDLLGVADRILRPLELLAGYLGGLIVLVLMVLGVVEVIGRSMFSSPIHGNIDIVEQLMVAVAALGIAYCQSKFGNIRMTLLTQNLTGRRKWFAESLSLAVAMFVVVVYLMGSYLNLERSLTLGGATPEISIPRWIGIGCVTVSFALLLARLTVQFLEALRLFATPEDSSRIITAFSHEQAGEH